MNGRHERAAALAVFLGHTRSAITALQYGATITSQQGERKRSELPFTATSLPTVFVGVSLTMYIHYISISVCMYVYIYVSVSTYTLTCANCTYVRIQCTYVCVYVCTLSIFVHKRYLPQYGCLGASWLQHTSRCTLAENMQGPEGLLEGALPQGHVHLPHQQEGLFKPAGNASICVSIVLTYPAVVVLCARCAHCCGAGPGCF